MNTRPRPDDRNARLPVLTVNVARTLILRVAQHQVRGDGFDLDAGQGRGELLKPVKVPASDHEVIPVDGQPLGEGPADPEDAPVTKASLLMMIALAGQEIDKQGVELLGAIELEPVTGAVDALSGYPPGGRSGRPEPR
jgi:hypothetical protein